MNILVTCMSQTGNTQKIAEAIFNEIPGEKEIKRLNDVNSLEEYDLTFIGFPIAQFSPAKPAQTFIETQTEGKNIVLFITHALPSKPVEPQQQKMIEGVLEKCKLCATQANVISIFSSQGELSETAANFMMKSDNPVLKKFGGMRTMTMGHPDAHDIEKARLFAREIVKNFKEST